MSKASSKAWSTRVSTLRRPVGAASALTCGIAADSIKSKACF